MAAAAGAGAGTPKRLLCIGMPLVELHTEVPASVLDRFDLRANTSVQVEEKHKPLRDLLLHSYRAQCAPGGGAATTAIAVQGLLRCADTRGGEASGGSSGPRVALLGAVGRDELGSKLRQLLFQEGVQALFSDSDLGASGWRAVLRCGRRGATSAEDAQGLGPPPGEEFETVGQLGPVSSAVFAGASRDYKLDHLRFKVWESVEVAKVVYVESLFLTVSAESAKSVAEYCAEMGNTFCLNLSAPYLCRFFYDRILTLLPYTDYVIGNEAEYLALAEHRKDDTGSDIDAVATWLGRLPRADGDAEKKRHIVVTCGNRPAIVAAAWRGYGVKVQRYPVPPVRAGRHIYKDGAGDAFAGGFLYGLMHSADMDGCMQMALHAAHVAVQRTAPGFVFKDKPTL